jgi:hypothetical protein
MFVCTKYCTWNSVRMYVCTYVHIHTLTTRLVLSHSQRFDVPRPWCDALDEPVGQASEWIILPSPHDRRLCCHHILQLPAFKLAPVSNSMQLQGFAEGGTHQSLPRCPLLRQMDIIDTL